MIKKGTIVHSFDPRDDREVFFVVLETGVRYISGDCCKVAEMGREEHGLYRMTRLLREATELPAIVAEVRARGVHQAAIEKLDEREREFLLGMLDYVELPEPVPSDSLEQLRALYDEHYDAIWLDGSLSDDNERHSADDYYQGYVAGARMALTLMLDAFGIKPEAEEEVS